MNNNINWLRYYKFNKTNVELHRDIEFLKYYFSTRIQNQL